MRLVQRYLVATVIAIIALLGGTYATLAQQPYPAPQGVGEIATPTAALFKAPEPNWFEPGETGILPVDPRQFQGVNTLGLKQIDGVPLQIGQDYWLLGRHICQDGKCVLAKCNNVTIANLTMDAEPFERWLNGLLPLYPYVGIKSKLIDDASMTFKVLDIAATYSSGYCDVAVAQKGWSDGEIFEGDGSQFLSACWSNGRQNRERYWSIRLATLHPIVMELIQAHQGYYTRVQAKLLEESTGSWRRSQVILFADQIHFVDPAGCGRRYVIDLPQAWRDACPLGMRVPNYNCKRKVFERFLPALPQSKIPDFDPDTGHYRIFMPQVSTAPTPTLKTEIVGGGGGINPKAQPAQTSIGWRLSPLRRGLPPLTLGNSVVVTEDADAVAQITGAGQIVNLIGDSFDRGDVSPGGVDCKDGQACLIINSNHANTWQLRVHDGRLMRITAPSNERAALKSAVVVLGQIGNGLHLAMVTESANCPTPTWSCGGSALVHIMINVATDEIFEVGRQWTNAPAAWGSIAVYNGEQLLHAYTREGVVYTLNWLTWTEARPRINDAPIVANLAMDEPLWEPGNMAWINGSMSLDGQFMFLGSGDGRGVIWIDLWNRQSGITSLKAAYVRALGVAMCHDEESPYYGLLAVHLTNKVSVFSWDATTHELTHVYSFWLPGWMQRTWEDDDQGDLAWVRDGLIANYNMPLPGTRAPALEFVKLGLLNGVFQLLEGYNVNPRNWPLDPGTPPPVEKQKAWGNSAWNQEHPGYRLPPTPTPVPPTATATATATETATSTPTMTLTPTPAPCVPGIMPADIVLVVDRSGSMAGEKLKGAKLAANIFLEQVMKSRDDRVALVAFDQTAGTLVHLTRDWKALESAIQSLEPGLGTYIDLGLKEASDELTFAKVPDRGQVVILLSDGGQNGTVTVPELIRMAEKMKSDGIIIFTIGLGTGIDEATLRALAFSPDHYYYAPSGADLAAIYQKIAIAIPCPAPTPAP